MNVKLAGHADVNAQTGRITASFEEAPQFPIGELNVTLNRAPGRRWPTRRRAARREAKDIDVLEPDHASD